MQAPATAATADGALQGGQREASATDVQRGLGWGCGTASWPILAQVAPRVSATLCQAD